MTITTQAVREMVERLEEEGRRSADSGVAANVAGAAASMLEDLVEERDRLATELDHQLAERAALRALVEERDRLAEANAKKADDIVTLGQLVGKAEARAEAAEAALRESEANRILLDALVAELKAEKQPTLGRFATLLRRATTKVNRAAAPTEARDG